MQVRGRCPACGNASLYTRPGEGIHCDWNAINNRMDLPGCPNPGAAHALLHEDHVTAHVLKIHSDGWWTIRHPLIERIDDDLFNCQIADDLNVALHANPRVAASMVGTWAVTDPGQAWIPVNPG